MARKVNENAGEITIVTAGRMTNLARLQQACDPSHREIVTFVETILRFRFGAYKEMNGLTSGSPLHDPLAVAVALDPGLAKMEEIRISIETKGSLSLGATIPDLRGLPRVGNVVSVCVDVEAERFIERFISVLSGIKEGAM